MADEKITIEVEAEDFDETVAAKELEGVEFNNVEDGMSEEDKEAEE